VLITRAGNPESCIHLTVGGEDPLVVGPQRVFWTRVVSPIRVYCRLVSKEADEDGFLPVIESGHRQKSRQMCHRRNPQ
jgi:hypothetical protein